MLGLMQDYPLLVHTFLDHGALNHGEREMVTRGVEGPIRRTTLSEVRKRALRVAKALEKEGISQADRIATMAWNTERHVEAWFGIMGHGAVCHTLNPRLFAEQLDYIVNHAEDRIMFVDSTFVPIMEALKDRFTTVEKYIVLTDSEPFAKLILAELQKQVAQLPRAKAAKESLKKLSAIVVLDDMAGVIEMADDFASEHLEIQCGQNSRQIADKIHNAGAIFIGPYTPVAVGDYWAGPSHTLPTGMRAKFASALTANDFLKSISIIEYDQEMLAACADDIVRLAEIEGLSAHARSVRIRQRD